MRLEKVRKSSNSFKVSIKSSPTEMKTSSCCIPFKRKSASPSYYHHHHSPIMAAWEEIGSETGSCSRSCSEVKTRNCKMKVKTVYKFYIKSVLLTCMMTLFCFSGPYPPVVDGGNPDAKRLYDDLLSNYNKLVRPVVNVSEAVTVMLKLKLSQLIDVVSL